MTQRPLSFVPAALRVLDLTLGEMLWSRRTVFMALVVGGPVIIALSVRSLYGLEWVDLEGRVDGRSLELTGPGLFGLMVWVLYVRFIVPVLGVFYGTSLIADEVEDKTITYLFTRPVARGAVLVGKYVAYLVCTVVVVLPSVVVVYFVLVPLGGGSIGASFPDLVLDLGLLVLGLAVYGAVFAFIGAWLRRPLLTGLVFIFGWEPVVVVLPGYLKYFTVAFYLQGLVPHVMPQDGTMSLVASVLQALQTAPSWSTSLLWLTVIWLVALGAAIRVVERQEYVLEQ